MTLEPGVRLGSYEIVAPLGAGGMGEVYKARDTRLNRYVAIKVLPAEFANDARLRIRFQREAKAISALNHPHICALYDVGPDYLVMEHCEGKTLAHRIAQGPLPLDQVVQYGIQIAEALDRAHRSGIIHRDLKPSNIMATKSGIKLLDFGLAKQHEVSSADSSTVQQVSEEGTIVGTVRYMAPEVLRGQDADARTDIFALGVILFEMATGRTAFAGDSKAEVIAAILEHEPPAVESSPALDRLVRTCVAKDPDVRFQSAFDVSLMLRSMTERTPRTRNSRAAAVSAFAAVAATAIAVTFAWRSTHRADQTLRPARFQLQPPAGVSVAETLAAATLAISPDGQWVAFRGAGGQGEKSGIYLRSIKDLDSHFIAASGYQPFFSPDSKWLAFFDTTSMWKVAVAGGPPTRICDVPRLRGATWGAGGTIVFSEGSGLRSVSADGGVPSDLTNPVKPERHLWPQFLPGNKHLLLTVHRGALGRMMRVAVMSLDDRKVRELAVGSYPRYANGLLVYGYNGTLFSLPFDATQMIPTGQPRIVLDDVNVWVGSGFHAFDLASDGSLVYTPGAPQIRDSEVVWVDRQGNASRAIDDVKPYDFAVLSPDQHKIAVAVKQSPDERDFWIFDRDHRTWTRLTSGMGVDGGAWSPDGQSFIFSGNSGGIPQLFRVSVDDGAKREQLTFGPDWVNGFTISPNGKVIVFQRQVAPAQWDLIAMSLDSPHTEVPFVASEVLEAMPQFSPDGRWIAYESDETGSRQVHVRPFPAREPRITVSNSGGETPRWRADGRQLFFRKQKELWSVNVDTRNGFHVSDPHLVFAAEWLGRAWAASYQSSPDGTKFLMIRYPAETQIERRLVYAPHWIDELKQ